MSRSELFRKSDYALIPYRSYEGIQFYWNWLHQDGHAIGLDSSAAIRIHTHAVTRVDGLFVRHDWSGKIKISVNHVEQDCFDLYSRVRFLQIVPLLRSS